MLKWFLSGCHSPSLLSRSSSLPPLFILAEADVPDKKLSLDTNPGGDEQCDRAVSQLVTAGTPIGLVGVNRFGPFDFGAYDY
ncbi:hypothetical protein IH781_01225, partial [Patescibacteria group bacterium]|nr:hypothetical protein [Patescibacteria group bacterium]